MARRPKWSLNSVEEKRELDIEGSVSDLVNQLSECPPDAYVDYIYGYEGYEGVEVCWRRDMTELEMGRERDRRTVKRRERAALKQKATEAEYRQYLRLEAKYGNDT